MKRAKWQVFLDAVSLRVVDADNDKRRNLFLANQAVSGFARLPGHAGEGGCRVKQVLAIIEIKNWIMPRAIFGCLVSLRKPDSEHSGIAEYPAMKFVQTKLRGKRV